MSEMVAASSAADEAQDQRRRRRPGPGVGGGRGRGRGRGPRNPRGEVKAEREAPAAEPAAEAEERAPRPRREYKDVPPEMIDQKAVGIVSVVVRKGRARFGFILIGEGIDVDAVDTAPRIYFGFSNIKDQGLVLRRGYLVTFFCRKDDKDRIYADEIELTEEGKTIQVAREERIAQRKAENPDGDRRPQRRPRGERPPPPEPRMVKLKVTCEGKGSAEKIVEVNAAQSVSKLKAAACAAFDTSLDLNVYFVPASGMKDMKFMSREQKAALADNDHIHLAAKKDE